MKYTISHTCRKTDDHRSIKTDLLIGLEGVKQLNRTFIILYTVAIKNGASVKLNSYLTITFTPVHSVTKDVDDLLRISLRDEKDDLNQSMKRNLNIESQYGSNKLDAIF